VDPDAPARLDETMAQIAGQSGATLHVYDHPGRAARRVVLRDTRDGGWDDRHMPVAHGRVALVTGSGGSGMRSTQERNRCGC
jgi:hypothetical protein